jgi:hypothetical protein
MVVTFPSFGHVQGEKGDRVTWEGGWIWKEGGGGSETNHHSFVE